MKRWTWMALLVTLVGCSVPAFSPRRMDARVDMGDLGNDAPGDVDAGTDASDAVNATEVVDAVTTDVTADADAADADVADEDAADADVADADAPDVNASDAPPDVVPGDVSVDVPPRPDATTLLTGSFVSSPVPSTPTGLLSGGFTWQGELRSERLSGRLR